MTNDNLPYLRQKYGIVPDAEPVSWVTCVGCAKNEPCFFAVGYPENGLLVDLTMFGFYGGFVDDLPDEVLAENKLSPLCHDCSVRLVTLFPALSERMGIGCHPCDLPEPCCDFAYKTQGNKIMFPENGKWK